MGNEDNEQWHLPAELSISNESVAEQAKQMAKQLKPRAISPFARLSPQEYERNRAAARIHHIADDLHRVDEALKVERGVVSHGKLKEARYALAARLAENLAITGEYHMAAEIAPDPEQQKEYAAVVRALVLDDSYNCQCAPGKLYVKQYAYSPKHKRMMPLLACSGCGLLNVTTLPDDLVKQQAARVKARALVAGMAPDEAAKTLRAANLTTDQVTRSR